MSKLQLSILSLIGPTAVIAVVVGYCNVTRRGSTPVCIDARASINLGSASIHIKVHRSISKVHAHHFLHFLGSTLGGYPTLGGWTFTQ